MLAGLSKLQNLRVFISACWLSSSIKQSLCQISPCGYYCFLISEIGHFSAFIRVFVAHRGGTGVPFSASFVTHIDSRAKKGDEGLELFPENGSLYKCDGLEPPIPQYPHRSVVFYPGPLPPKRPGWQASPAASRSLPPRIAAGDFFAWKKVARFSGKGEILPRSDHGPGAVLCHSVRLVPLNRELQIRIMLWAHYSAGSASLLPAKGGKFSRGNLF